MSDAAPAAKNLRLKADLALALCTLVWGATFVIVKNALADASMLAFLSVRFIFATALMAVVFRRALSKTSWREIAAGAWIGIFMFAGYALQTAGLAYTTPSKAGFITGTSVVMVPLLQAVFWRSRVGVWVVAGVIAAVAGMYFLTVPPEGMAHLNRGDVMVVGCAVMFALHILFVGHFSPKHSPGALTFHQIAMTAFLATCALPIAGAAGWQAPKFHATPQLLIAIVVTAALATDLAFFVQVWAQQHTTPTHTALLFSLEPVFAGVTSYIVLHERLSARALGGAALILAGIVLAEVRSGAPVSPETTE